MNIKQQIEPRISIPEKVIKDLGHNPYLLGVYVKLLHLMYEKPIVISFWGDPSWGSGIDDAIKELTHAGYLVENDDYLILLDRHDPLLNENYTLEVVSK